MMFGCSSFAEVRASRWKRSTNSLSNARENGSTLMATSRSSSFSFALKTIAMPPLSDENDPLLGAAKVLIKVGEQPDRLEMGKELAAALKESSGAAAVPLLRAMSRRALLAAQ